MKIFPKALSLIESLYTEFLVVCAGLSSLSATLLAVRFFVADSIHYGFLAWNLFLAWLPALLSWRIIRYTSKKNLKPSVIFWLIAWVLFLPNTFYIVTDFIHLDRLDGISKLFDACLVFTFSLTGFALGIASMLAVHVWLEKYISRQKAILSIGGVILLSSFAIYLGRYLRWNSWDVVFNPFGLLFDVSDRVINPSSHPQTFSTTLLFFVVISSIYASVRFYGIRLLRLIQKVV